MDDALIDPRQFRDVLGHYASGVTVVAGLVEGAPVGFTCQSFHSVSVEPPLVLLCIMKSSTSWPRIRSTGRFCVNVLSNDQRAISDAFARSGGDKWTGVAWMPHRSGNPLIEQSLIWLDCSLQSEYDAGDHMVVLGRVLDMSEADFDAPRMPLIYFRERYHELQGH